MPRKLKTFITNFGFFELAVATPSMKAALEAWGLNHNAFQHSFAKQTEDSKIVEAALAEPGVVLKADGSNRPRQRQTALMTLLLSYFRRLPGARWLFVTVAVTA